MVSAVRSFSLNSNGSAFAAAASSSMNDSAANVDCGPLGSRRFPVRSGVSQISGRLTTSADIRRLGMAYISEGVAALPLAGLARRDPHELGDQYGIGLVIADVIVVCGAGMVIVGHQTSPRHPARRAF